MQKQPSSEIKSIPLIQPPAALKLKVLKGWKISGEEGIISKPVNDISPLSSAKDAGFVRLSALEVKIEGKDGVSRPWRLLREEERSACEKELAEVFRASYAKAGLPYTDGEKILRRLPFWMVAANSEGKIVAFATFSEVKSGIRLGLIGAKPGSIEGRAAAKTFITHFGAQEGFYGLVSGRVAHISFKAGVPIVGFKDAQRLMGKPKGAKFSSAQQKMNKIKKMEGFEDSPLVRHAAQRTGRKTCELEFKDLVEQAIKDGEIPDTPEARNNCFALMQNVDNLPTVVIKIIVGRPL
jgi:hypothetical protein